MHGRNIYSKPIQFEELAHTYPPLLEHINSGQPIDFRNAEVLRCLTQALLRRDFGLQLTLPEDRLCPPVPNRLNYVLWIQDIMRSQHFLSQEDTRTIHGIDMSILYFLDVYRAKFLFAVGQVLLPFILSWHAKWSHLGILSQQKSMTSP